MYSFCINSLIGIALSSNLLSIYDAVDILQFLFGFVEECDWWKITLVVIGSKNGRNGGNQSTL